MKEDHVDFIQAQWAKERPDLDTAPMGVIGRLSRVSRYIDRLLQENFSKFELNGGEFDVLASLRRAGSPYQLTPTELFQVLMLSSGAMTNRLDRLEQAGLIQRSHNPDDRRGILVSLTKQGLALIDKAYPAHLAHEARMLRSLTGAEREKLTSLLRKMLRSFEDEE
jgi:DNA-binding MarR family transcriptional regulator